MADTYSHYARKHPHPEELDDDDLSRKRKASDGTGGVGVEAATAQPTAQQQITSYDPESVNALFCEAFPLDTWYDTAADLFKAVTEWANQYYFTVRKEGKQKILCSRAANTNSRKKDAKEKTVTKEFAMASGCPVEIRFSLKKKDNGRVKITYVNGLHNHPLDAPHVAKLQRLAGPKRPFRLSKGAIPKSSTLRITILGGGNVGSTLAHKLVTSNKFASVEIAARDPVKTTAEIQNKGILDVQVVPASPESMLSSHVVILATPGIYDDEEMKAFASSLGDMRDKVIIDATNPLGPFTDGLQVRTWEGGISSGEMLQSHLPQSRVYKAFNTVGVEHMREALGKDMMIAGDPDPSYRAMAEAVVAAVGFKPFYVGPIRYSRNLEAMAELWIHMAIPGLGGRSASRNFWFSIGGDP